MVKRNSLWNQFKGRIYKKIANEQVSYSLEAIHLLLHMKLFFKTYTFLKKSQWWTKEQIETYQQQQLQKLLVHSYEHVPYYHKLFDAIGFSPYDFKDFEDLQKIPFLTKEIIRDNLQDLKAQDYPDYAFCYMTTGGTTASPLGIYEEKNLSYIKELAYTKIFFENIGLKLYDKSVFLRGTVIAQSDKGSYWKYTLFHRFLILSSYHMTETNLPVYVEKIRKFKPKYITAYPSSLCILAKHMKNNNIPPFASLKYIICGAETLYPWQRTFLEDIFQCKIHETYGHTEQAVLANTCKDSTFFHFYPEYGYVEFIDRNGKPVKNDHEVAEIVATGFKNDIFPFIRYKTDDCCIYTSQSCSCGRKYPLAISIEGRWSSSDFLISKDDRLVSITAMNMHSDIFDNVNQFQFYQENKGEVIFRIVKMDTYSDNDAKNIRQQLLKKLGDNFSLTFEYVKEIPRTPRGKLKFLIQKIPVNIWNSKDNYDAE